MPTVVHRYRIAVVCSVPDGTTESDAELMSKPAAVARALLFLREAMQRSIPEGHLCALVVEEGPGLGEEWVGDGDAA